jgi:hypothetical protein
MLVVDVFPKQMLAKYKSIIMQMWAYQLACDVTKANIVVLHNVQLGFHCLMPLLELLHGLIKMVQVWDICVVDFVEVGKLM